MTVKALIPVRTVNLVAPLAHKATDMHAPWLAPALGGRLNPYFTEFLMGWPIQWTQVNVDESSDSQARAARNTNLWKELLQVRLNQLFAPSSRGLQKATGRSNSLSEVSRTGASGEFSEWDACGSGVHMLRDDVQAESIKTGEAVRESGMPSEERTRGWIETVGRPGNHEEVPELRKRFQDESAEGQNMLQIVREQVGMEEQAMSSRAARLKCCGNGVVPLQAAAAAVVLVRRMMEAA